MLWPVDGGKEGIMVKKMYQMVALYIYVCVKLFIFSILLSLCISWMVCSEEG